MLTDKIEEMEKEGENLKGAHAKELETVEISIKSKYDEQMRERERKIIDLQAELTSLQ